MKIINIFEYLKKKKPTLSHFIQAEAKGKTASTLSDSEALGVIYNIFGNNSLDEIDKHDLTHQLLLKLEDKANKQGNSDKFYEKYKLINALKMIKKEYAEKEVIDPIKTLETIYLIADEAINNNNIVKG